MGLSPGFSAISSCFSSLCLHIRNITNVARLKAPPVVAKFSAPILSRNTVIPTPSSFYRSLSTSHHRSARGNRIERATSEYEDIDAIDPEFRRNALPVEDEIFDIGSATPRHHLHPDASARCIKELVEDAASFDEMRPQSPDDQWATSPYQNVPYLKRQKIQEQGKKVSRSPVDPKLTSIVLFPGQGSQFVGMGRKLLQYPNVKEIYGLASEILGYDLLKVCLEGPEAELARTVRCQLAVFVTQVAALEKLKQDYPIAVESCVSAAGFSVGEYAALVFAGSFSFEDALSVVKARAEAMQAVSEKVSSGMMTILIKHDSKLGQAMEVAREWCKEKRNIAIPYCSVANYLHPDMKVVGGHKEALDFLDANADLFKLRVVKRLNVSGAFHTPLMKEAQDSLYDALRTTRINKPTINVHSNVTALKYGDRKKIITLLLRQISAPVRWEQTMHCIYERRPGEDFPHTYEVGPGRQLGAVLRKINAKAFQSYTAIEV